MFFNCLDFFSVTCHLCLQVREVLATCLSHRLVETEEYKEAHKLLNLMAREELLPILTRVMDVLQGKKK